MQKKISELNQAETVGLEDTIILNQQLETKKATVLALKSSLGVPQVNNGANNRLITHAENSNTLNAESNATFDGTTLNINGELTVDNISINSNIITNTIENGSLVLKPNGTGAIQKDEQGQTRGSHAIDLQSWRSASSQVAAGDRSVIGGGTHNSIGLNAYGSVVSGGSGNSISGQYGVIGGGSSNKVEVTYASHSTISGGTENIVNGDRSSIGGGSFNTIASAGGSVISGGQNNFISESHGTIGGGEGNRIEGGDESEHATISGGLQNRVFPEAAMSVIGGGYRNKCSGRLATISGGDNNNIEEIGEFGTIGGGLNNSIKSGGGTIGGGASNEIGGGMSTIPGGTGARTQNFGEYAHSSGNFVNPGDAQHSVFIARGITVGSEQNKRIYLNGDGHQGYSAAKLVIPDNSMWTFEIKVSAISIYNNDSVEEGEFLKTTLGAWWIFKGGALVQSVEGSFADYSNQARILPGLITESGCDSELSEASVTISAYEGSPYDEPTALDIKVTGVSGKTINWVAVISVSQVTQVTPTPTPTPTPEPTLTPEPTPTPEPSSPPPDPFATLVTTQTVANVSGSARSTTGYIKVQWWDSTSNVYGTGGVGNNIFWSKGAGDAGSKTFRIYPSDASGNLAGSLTTLNCFNNSLTSLNVSGLTALTGLSCQSNPLASLDLSGLTSLTTLNCTSNSLTSLDLSGLTSLTTLFCSNNSLTSLDVSGLASLTALHCFGNSLTSLDLSGLTSLTTLFCSNNSLTSLDLSGLTSLTALNCFGNSLTSLDVSGLTSLTTLNCFGNSLASLDVSDLTALTQLTCNNNSLTSLDVSGCTALQYIRCDNNEDIPQRRNSLTSLDLSGLTALTYLQCNNNSLTSLDLSGLTALTYLQCNNNSLTSLRAVGVVFDSGKWKNKNNGKARGVQQIEGNQLSAAALNQFYTDLGVTTAGTGFLDVQANPGVTTHDPSIATSKGYVVFDGRNSRTLYFNGAVDSDWSGLGNWWNDASHTEAATSLPAEIDSVVVAASITASGQTVRNFTTLTDLNDFSLGGTLTVTGMATFNGNTYNEATVNGNATFNNYSYNSGTVNGNATFNNDSYNGGTVNGNATFNNDSYNGGTVTGDATFNDDSYSVPTPTPTPTPISFATLVSTKSESSVGGNARSTTGYIKVEWWDNTSNVYGDGGANSSISWAKAAGAGEKILRIYPSDVSGNLAGSLTLLFCSDISLTSLDVSGLTSLTQLYCNSNSLTSLNVSGCTALTNLQCYGNALTSLDVSGLTSLTGLDCFVNSLTSLDVSGCTALQYIRCSHNSLTSLDVSGCTALTSLNCNNNDLVTLRAAGVSFGFWKNKKKQNAGESCNATDNQLDAVALNQFYTDLAPGIPGASFLNVENNPGSATHDPTIATSKGYVVFA
jgi:Leucine-rich repeat (LRR) protein